MRFIVAAAVTLLIGPALAQTQLDRQDIVRRAQEAFQNAKTEKEREGVRLWCRDMGRAVDFKHRDELMGEGVRLMEAGKLGEANERMKQVAQLEEMTDTITNIVCKP